MKREHETHSMNALSIDCPWCGKLIHDDFDDVIERHVSDHGVVETTCDVCNKPVLVIVDVRMMLARRVEVDGDT